MLSHEAKIERVIEVCQERGLTDRQIEVMVARLDKEPQEETAERLGISVGAVKATLYQGKKKIGID